ncbi:uncharacterized protein LOC126884495 [Diabrotica virgifera virgifera]|uniref:Rad21/Rec8-like protein N-terminal domain-containing protein n=1 Tax=Diabrotica virgifera virgifera TaxID=50390 RepID=A0ABM5K875_DIAVI|nr:uncharacterized protein LOC126884495 [Diabrotica virgifera virgifera]
MFYDIILLSSQHKGQYCKAWIAGTRGVKFIKEAEIKELDIAKLCDNIIEYVITASSSPTKRFSLRLSTILTNGAIKILRQQAVILQGECTKAMCVISIPATISVGYDEIGDVMSSLSPVAKVVRKKRAKKVKIINTPDVLQAMEQALLDEHEQTPILLEPAAEAGFSNKVISIVEEVAETRRQQPDEEFLSLGPALNVDDILLETGYPKPRSGSSSSIPYGTIGPQITVVADVHVAIVSPVPELIPSAMIDDVTQRPTVIEEIITEAEMLAEKRSTVIEEIITEAEMLPPTEIPPIATSTPMVDTAAAAKRAVRPGVLKEIQLEEVQEERAEKRAETRKPVEEQRVVSKKEQLVADEEYKRIFLPTSSTRFTRINRCLPGHEDMFVAEYTPSITVFPKKDIIYLYQTEEEQSQIDLEQAVRTAGSSLERTDRQRGTLSMQNITDEPIILPRSTLELQPKPGSTSTPKGKDRPTSLEQELPPNISTTPKGRIRLASEEPTLIDASPRKKAKRQVIPDESRPSDKTKEAPSAIEIELPEAVPSQRTEILSPIIEELLVLPSLPFQSSKLSPQTTVDFKGRHQRLMDIITKFNFDEGFPTIEDLSEKPLNKLHVARCFHDLLALCAFKYVTLIPEENSIELRHIEKGPRFL